MLVADLKTLFEAGPPLPYVGRPIAADATAERAWDGVAAFASLVRDAEPSVLARVESYREKKVRERAARADEHRRARDVARAQFDPREDPEGVKTRNPWATLVLARLSHATSDRQIRAALETYGAIKSVRVVRDREGRPRGYAFVEFANERDMRAAYERAHGTRIDGHRVLVDVERARTQLGVFFPRRLGGGLGTTRASRLPKGAPRRARAVPLTAAAAAAAAAAPPPPPPPSSRQ